jgi:lipoic acid synthetase
MDCNSGVISAPSRFPSWLKKRFSPAPEAARVADLLGGLGLATVCSQARCPNLPECYGRGTLTFLILGERCTRSCRFCAVRSGPPVGPREQEPQAVAEACARLRLRHVVITSVTRDDLPDGGAGQFARTIGAVRARLANAVIEVLVPDFAGSRKSVRAVLVAGPDVFGHNVETVPRLYPGVRPQACYRRSLAVLEQAGRHARPDRRLFTKSGLMLGLGETHQEVEAVLVHLRRVGCDMLTLGQYLSPTAAHLPVQRFLRPEEFDRWRRRALSLGFLGVAAGPFVRSSYLAESLFHSVAASACQGRQRRAGPTAPLAHAAEQ